MSVVIGYLNGEPQELTLLAGRYHINGQIQPIRDASPEELEELEELLESAPEGDEAAREAWRNTKRIQFLVRLLGRTFGDEGTALLEHLIGSLNYQVLAFLGETDDLDEEARERAFVPRHDHGHGHDHDGCGHSHG